MSTSSEDRVFHLHACNVPVKGAFKSIICDLQRSSFFEIPNDLYALLVDHRGQSLAEIKAAFADEEGPAIEAAFEQLVAIELGFWRVGNAARFPPLDLAYERPERINNAIIDVNASSRHDYADLFAQLDGLGCLHVELRAYDPIPLLDLDRALTPTLKGRLRTIQLILPHADWSDADIERLGTKHARLARITFHGAPHDQMTRTRHLTVIHVRERIESADACGRVHPGYFATNLTAFTEAQHFNSCLNKKLGIDLDGNIKNCPSCRHHFGNTTSVPLADVVRTQEFQTPWTLRRDDIEICRDCEYRYICTDCRVFTQDPDNPNAKPAKCTYDPYTGQWGPGAA